MATPVIMPKQGQSVESCIITKWHKKEGDEVKLGDLLFSFETDKAGFDETAQASGTLLAVFSREDDEVPVLQTIAVIGTPGENPESFRPQQEFRQAADKDASEQGASGVDTSGDASTEDAQELEIRNTDISHAVKISPRALQLAQKLGVDFRFAVPTGPGGRIIEQDIDALYLDNGFTFAGREKAGIEIEGTGIGGRVTLEDIERHRQHADSTMAPAAKPTRAPFASGDTSEINRPDVDANANATGAHEKTPLSKVRKLIAKSMHASLANTAQLTLNSSFDATRIMEFRRMNNAGSVKSGAGAGSSSAAPNITLTAIILHAVSRLLPKHPALNAHMGADTLFLYKNVNVGIAVDTPRGLLVPTLREANLKSLAEIAKEAGELAESARSGAINPDLLSGGTFTVTNLGAFGVESFTPILNPPQTGILGVNAITTRMREANGKMTAYPAMGLSLTFDHRAIDGAPAAKFLQELSAALENFEPTGDEK